MTIRQNALVEFTESYREWSLKQDTSNAPRIAAFFECDRFWCLGEIPNVAGNCLVADVDTGVIYEGAIGTFIEV